MEELFEQLNDENKDILMLVAQGIMLGQQEASKGKE